MPFSALGLSPLFDPALEQFDEPTAVQVAAIPEVLGGGDLLATAKTGSGKTTAFVLPLLERWMKTSGTKPKKVFALILVPTRELAAQVREVVQDYAKCLPERVKVVSAVGGVSINPQMMALRGGADFIVATPGRLLDLVEKNALKIDAVKTLVLDEADRMLDLGFADELARILELLPKERQNLLFSATFPKAVESMAGEILKEPRRIEVDHEPEDAPDIEQRAIRVDTVKRTPLLRHLLEENDWESVLVFVGKKYTAELVAEKLSRKGIDAMALHGDLSQGARSEVLGFFKEGTIRVMVATDLAARGLDIEGLQVVLNYELPRSPADYIHRIGRTGRAGKKGEAISFVTAESVAHFDLIEKRNGLSMPREVIEEFEPTDPIPEAPGTGGVKGKRKSKKDKLREAAARKARGDSRTGE
ncbi:MAG: DEAD/DEAH box helicase [Verrucomicrobiaceae bacterium]